MGWLAILAVIAVILLIVGGIIAARSGSSSMVGCSIMGCVVQILVLVIAFAIGNFVSIKLFENIVGSMTAAGAITDPVRFWVCIIIILLIGIS